MAIIKCPNPFDGVAYGVTWEKGIANIESQDLIDRLLSRGYVIEEQKAEKPRKPRKAKEA